MKVSYKYTKTGIIFQFASEMVLRSATRDLVREKQSKRKRYRQVTLDSMEISGYRRL
jgi:hypothetical protein